MKSTEWAGIHLECGGQLRILPNSIEGRNHECMACGDSVQDNYIVFKSDDVRKLPDGYEPADILQLSREERRSLKQCSSDDQIRHRLEKLLEEKAIF